MADEVVDTSNDPFCAITMDEDTNSVFLSSAAWSSAISYTDNYL